MIRSQGKRMPMKRMIAAGSAAIIVVVAGGWFFLFRTKGKQELKQQEIIAVDAGDLSEVFQTPATVESGQQGSFTILEGTRVERVAVDVGVVVQAGDLLATFDTEYLNDLLRRKKQEYENARKALKNYVNQTNNAPKQTLALQKQIAALELKLKDLQKKEVPPKENPGEPSKEQKQLEGIKAAVAAMLGNTRTANWIVDRVFAENGSAAQTIAVFQNLLGGGYGFDTSGLQKFMDGMGTLGNTELMSTSIQLVQLRVQEVILGFQGGQSLESIYQAVADSAKQAYTQVEATISSLRGGWYAERDGIVREVNLKTGEVWQSGSAPPVNLSVTSLLASLSAGQGDVMSLLSGLFQPSSAGIVVEYYPFQAAFVLSKHDLEKVHLGQNATIKNAQGKEFAGEVTFISPVAQEEGSFNISSIIGGSSSSKGVKALVTIPEPDKSVVIGLDVEVTIPLETHSNVVRVPVSAVEYEGEECFVFAYDAGKQSVTRKRIETGLLAGVWYEVTEGLSAGEEILRTVPNYVKELKEGEFLRIKILS